MLHAHAAAKDRTSIAHQDAAAAGYKDLRGSISGYGNLAKRLGAATGEENARIGLLVEFANPEGLRNKEWLVLMRDELLSRRGARAEGRILSRPLIEDLSSELGPRSRAPSATRDVARYQQPVGTASAPHLASL